MRVKVIGAGSIGNHLSHAARQRGHSVVLCDIDPEALRRTEQDIYPSRYGSWDERIETYLSNNAPTGNFDLIVIGTPPDTHISLALDAVSERPQAILIEKPFSPPSLEGCQELVEKAKGNGVKLFVGYDHVLGKATKAVEDWLAKDFIGDVQSIDVEFREFWGGIFAAHPWLEGPHDSYLGFTNRGGGALCEHSHALNLWQHFARVAGCGEVSQVSADMVFVDDGRVCYDSIAALQLRTDKGLVGRVIQDVVSLPVRKRALIQGSNGAVEWICGWKAGFDAVIVTTNSHPPKIQEIAKTRPEDFILEVTHLEENLNGQATISPIDAKFGISTMNVVNAAFQAHKTSTVVYLSQ